MKSLTSSVYSVALEVAKVLVGQHTQIKIYNHHVHRTTTSFKVKQITQPAVVGTQKEQQNSHWHNTFKAHCWSAEETKFFALARKELKFAHAARTSYFKFNHVTIFTFQVSCANEPVYYILL